MTKLKEKQEKKWIIKSEHSPIPRAGADEIAEGLGINPVLARLLYSRGFCDVASAKDFIYMENELLVDPFLMADMQKGVERLMQAARNGEKIAVYGDYDVDGVTSVCTLYLYLKSLGCRVEYYIPNRAGEGYGVSKQAIEALHNDEGVTLIVTVDTGITANEEVEYAREIGVDFIITDHHECRAEIPCAAAVINPHRPDCPYPFKDLAGVGVVFKFISAFEEMYFGVSKLSAAKKLFASYSDLVAIGTIADVMPIRGENRIIVKHGLRQIQNTKREGLSALIEASSSRGEGRRGTRDFSIPKITSSYIGYTLAPRINAAGRIYCASIAVELFLAEEHERAYEIAEQLCSMNKERQAEENKIMNDAYAKIEAQGLSDDPVIVLDADNWHHGVIGIVSSRITEKYSRPSILVSFEGNGEGEPSPDDVGKGSGRSIKGMNLVDALMYSSEYLVKFGGHELAAGLSVKRGELDSFRRKINEYARENLKNEDMIPTVEADLTVEYREVNLALAKSLHLLEPYGVGNPIPHFVLRGVTVRELTGVSDGKHTRLSVGDGAGSVTAMFFGHSPDSLGIHVGDRVDVLFNLDVNEWGGRESVQLIVRDICICGSQLDEWALERERFEEIRHGAPFKVGENVIPTREDFAEVYKLMQLSLRQGVDTLSHRDIIARLTNAGSNIGYAKLKFIIMVLKELNLVKITDVGEELYRFEIHYTTGKTMLDRSAILKRLRQQQARGRM